jgi:predicted acylesterase/phospholipase RssA
MSSFVAELIEKHRFNCISIDHVVDVLDTFGVDDGSNIDRALNLTLSKYAKREDMTFKTLAQTTGVDLVVCAMNMTRRRLEYMSLDTTPNMSVKTAVRMSMSLPLIFKPVKYRKSYYVDPLFGRNFPFDFPGREREPPQSVLGLNLSNTREGEKIDDESRENFTSYVLSLLSVMLTNSNSQMNSQIQTSHQTTPLSNDTRIDMILVTIDVDVVHSFDTNKMQFHWSKELASELTRTGYKATESNQDILRMVLTSGVPEVIQESESISDKSSHENQNSDII